jgi:hypothetical protein
LPPQITVELALIEIEGVTDGDILTISCAEFTVVGEAQFAFDVNMQLTTSPLLNVDEE